MGKRKRELARAKRAREQAEKATLIEKGILKPKALPATEKPKEKVMFVLRSARGKPILVIDKTERESK